MACAWQDAPRDVSAAYLTSLSSTQAVLAALQKGFTARQRLMAKSPPLKIRSLPLYDLETRPTLLPGFVWSRQTVESAICSPNGKHMAAVVKHKQSDPEHEEYESESDGSEDFDTPAFLYSAEVHEVCTYDVLLYEASDGFKQCARFDSQVRAPIIHWSPASCLCVAQLLATGTRGCYDLDAGWSIDMSMKTAAFIYHPDWGSAYGCDEALCLSDQATIRLSTLGKRCQVQSCWSPSGQYLLVHGAQFPGHGRTEASGWLAIADVEKGKLVAESNFRSASTESDEAHLSFVWHPSSQALIMHGALELLDMAAITRAGFGVGRLPSELRMHAAGFSADASLLLAESYDTYIGHDRWCCYCVECSIQGLQVCLRQRQTQALPDFDEEVYIIGWTPGANTLFLECAGMGSPTQIPVSGTGCKQADPSWTALSGCGRICSSGMLYMKGSSLDEELCMTIAEVKGGQEILCPSTSDLDWSAMHEQPEGFEGVPDSLRCQAWAPTGVGPVCSSIGIDALAYGGGYLPPALHFYIFS